MLDALIDPGGCIWAPDSPAIRQQFGTSLASNVLSNYLCQNMGWINLRYGPRTAVISCRPSRISNEAIAAAAYFLADNKISAARLPSATGPPACQRVVGLTRIVAALERLALVCPLNENDALHCHRSAPASHSPFLGISEQLKRSGMLTHTMDDLVQVCNAALGGRFTLATASEPGRRVRIVSIGTSYTHFKDSYYRNAIGLGFEDSPDICYGRWIAGTMGDALGSLRQSFGEVDAEARLYRAGYVRIRYDRMILPFIGADGQRYVLSASQMRDTIDLRKRAV